MATELMPKMLQADKYKISTPGREEMTQMALSAWREEELNFSSNYCIVKFSSNYLSQINLSNPKIAL